MVNPFTPFRKHSTVRQKLIFMFALTSVYLAKSVLKYKNSDVVEYHGTINGDCAGWPYHVVKVFDDKMIVYQRIWLQSHNQ